MKNFNFTFYSVLKNEDAIPFIGGNIIAVADGLGGSGSAVHAIDRSEHKDMYGDIMSCAFGDMKEMSPILAKYIGELVAPMADGVDDTSALWASRIAIARCVYALTQGKFAKSDLSDKKERAKLADFIGYGLHETAKKFDIKKGRYDEQLLLPTTLAFMRCTEKKKSVVVETLWAGDSRCYAVTADGLRQLSVDDEDNSGSITNLFFADNEKAKLNYICHEIQKPCALFAVSDGVFDPFDPYENLGVEHTLLSAIGQCGSYEELSGSLCDFYGSVHGDDATMAFVCFGFDSYEDMQKKFEKRTNEIIAVRNDQSELYEALSVMNQTEEEASHYVMSRTGDRYDYIIPMIIDAVEKGVDDISVTSAVRKIVEKVRNDYGAKEIKARKTNTEQAFLQLYNYVKAHPESVTRIFVPYDDIAFGTNVVEGKAYSDMITNACEYYDAAFNETLIAMEAELADRREELHRKVMEKIVFYRNRFDSIWDDKSSDCKTRQNIARYLRVWQDIDLSLQYDWGVSGIGNLPVEDIPLAYAVRDYIDESKRVKSKIKTMRQNGESNLRIFAESWNKVYAYIKKHPSSISVLLTPEAVREFAFGEPEEKFEIELGKNMRSAITAQLKAMKSVAVQDIVRSLAVNHRKTSIIDGQYNATKLELFRTYFRLKASDDTDVKALEEKLRALETEYTELITK